MQCNAVQQCTKLYFAVAFHFILLHCSTALHFAALQYCRTFFFTDHDNIADDLKPFLGCIVRAAITNRIPRWPDKGSVGQEQMRVDPEWPGWQYGGQSGGSMVASGVAVWWS